MWVANGDWPGGSLQQVDPEFRQLTGDPVEEAAAGAITLGDGAIWGADESRVTKINPPGAWWARRSPTRLRAGSRWRRCALGLERRRILRVAVQPDDLRERAGGRSNQRGRRPVAIAWDEEGAVWTANQGDNNVSHIDPASSAVNTIPVGRTPTAIAVGEGFVWVANSGDGTVTKIDPATREPVDLIETGNYPAGLAMGAGFVWVTVQSP